MSCILIFVVDGFQTLSCTNKQTNIVLTVTNVLLHNKHTIPFHSISHTNKSQIWTNEHIILTPSLSQIAQNTKTKTTITHNCTSYKIYCTICTNSRWNTSDTKLSNKRDVQTNNINLVRKLSVVVVVRQKHVCHLRQSLYEISAMICMYIVGKYIIAQTFAFLPPQTTEMRQDAVLSYSVKQIKLLAMYINYMDSGFFARCMIIRNDITPFSSKKKIEEAKNTMNVCQRYDGHIANNMATDSVGRNNRFSVDVLGNLISI